MIIIMMASSSTSACLFLLNFFTWTISAEIPPVVPLTNAFTAVYCHQPNEPGIMTIRCGTNEKIRMLDAFDAAVRNKSHLPEQCAQRNFVSTNDFDSNNRTQCRIHTSFSSACSGRENCTLHMQRIRLNSLQDNCHNEWVDYTMAFFECVSDAFIHNVCSPQSITSAWGTLQTPNFPQPYTSSEDCWCKLTTQAQQRLLLSIIVFQLIPYDQQCAGAGLYLQSSDQQRSTQCTYLQQGHNYLSNSNSLYLNFYSRTPTVRGGFWIIYEATHPAAEVHLQCGSKEQLGVPSFSIVPTPVSTPYDYGWSRLVFNNPPNPTAAFENNRLFTSTPTSTTTPQPVTHSNSKIDSSTAIGAFTYPHGSLTTFELAYGPQGWYLKHPARLTNKTLATTVRIPISSTSNKWNLTWRYTYPFRRPITTKTTMSNRNMDTTVPTTVTAGIFKTDNKIITDSTITTTKTTNNPPIERVTTTTQTITRTSTSHRRVLSTHKASISKIPTLSSAIESPISSSTIKSILISSINPPTTTKSTLSLITSRYLPESPYDWWHWNWYSTKSKKTHLPITFTTPTTSMTTLTTSTKTLTTSSSTVTTITSTKNKIQTTTFPTTTSVKTTSLPTSKTTEKKTTNPVTTRTSATSTTKSSTAMPTRLTVTPTTSTSRSKLTFPSKWLQMPYKDSNSIKKDMLNEFDEEYKDWLGFLTTSEIEYMITTTPITTTKIGSVSPRFSDTYDTKSTTKSQWPSDEHVVTVVTPPAKRQHSHLNPSVSERNAVATQQHEQAMASDYHNMIRRVIESRNKVPNNYGWLSKTDLTIVAVSILFVILLAIINLILFAVRRHRHRLQAQHFLSTPMGSKMNDRRLRHHLSRGGPPTDGSNHSMPLSNNPNNNDILPAVGEIVIWDEKDQGGYMIDNDGAWAKIEGRQWFGSNIFKSCSKTSISKSFRSRFRLIRHSDKKASGHHPAPIATKANGSNQQVFKHPLALDTAILSPVPEADDYESSELSLSDVAVRSTGAISNHSVKIKQALIKSERQLHLPVQNEDSSQKLVQVLVHSEQEQANYDDDYYKHNENPMDDPNYTVIPGHATRMGMESSMIDQETDRSLGNEIDTGGPVLVHMPSMYRRDDDAATIADGIDSIYNPNYDIHDLNETTDHFCSNNNPEQTISHFPKPSLTTFKPNTVVVGHCQTEFQSLDPKLLLKSSEKSSLVDPSRFFRTLQSAHVSVHDSGFVDDQTVESSTTMRGATSSTDRSELIQNNEQMAMDDILLTKSEDDDDEEVQNRETQIGPVSLSAGDLRNSHRQKWKQAGKRVSFQEEHVVQRFVSTSPVFNIKHHVETSTNPSETYESCPEILPGMRSISSEERIIKSVSIKNKSNENDSMTNVRRSPTPRVTTSIDREDTTQTIIMDHLHSVKSLKKFFETRMVVQHSMNNNSTVPNSTHCQVLSATVEQRHDNKSDEQNGQRQEMMNKVLDSLKRKTSHSQTPDDLADSNGRSSDFDLSLSCEGNQTQNLPIQQQYSRRFRSSPTSNNSHLGQDRQHYHTTDHFLNHIDKWKAEQQQRVNESDDDDNASESSMLWQARTKLNQFVSRTKKSHQQSPYCTVLATTEDFYTFDENESVTAETRF